MRAFTAFLIEQHLSKNLGDSHERCDHPAAAIRTVPSPGLDKVVIFGVSAK
jgi:hypothetical protein